MQIASLVGTADISLFEKGPVFVFILVELPGFTQEKPRLQRIATIM